MQHLKQRLDELNELAEDGEGQMVPGAAGRQHVLRAPDPVRLVVFRDGLQLHRQPARPYTDPSSKAVLQDVLDGYFPYVLKNEFPNGVPIKLVDRLGERMSQASPHAQHGNIRTFDDLEAGPSSAPISRDQFLNKLPQAVIRNGKVIEIRGEVGRMMGGDAQRPAASASSAQDVCIISTPADELLSTVQRNHVGPVLPPSSRDGSHGSVSSSVEITTLQVKSEDGRHTYILKLCYDDTIAALRKCLDAYRARLPEASRPHPGARYEIRSAFPARAFIDPQETLRQAGLVPNATLFLRTTQ